jgi:cellulose synthase/poly-beta-1,6-N-acetylglucosamine synthase-like glycosyltransferase
MTSFAVWQIIFWLSMLGIAYIFVGYPLLVCALSRLRPLQTTKTANAEAISVVLVGYNEAARLPAKIANILASDDVHLIRKLIIASDGSTDDTAIVIANLNDSRVRLVEFSERRGKPSVLNEVIPQCLSDIVVLMDARQELDRRAIAELAAHFTDKSVGVVSGELVFRSEGDTTTVSKGIGIYWRYEKLIRKCEGRFRSVPGATGALYALRRSLFRPIPSQTILDDVVIPMQAVTAGYRCLFEPAAIAFDHASDSTTKESIRKRRTVAGAAQLIVNHPDWLLPWRNPIWFEFVSHKLARLFSPVLLLVAAAANLWLASHPIYAVLLMWHVAFYASALVGWWFQKAGRRSVLFGAQLMFVALNATTVVALWDALRGRFRATWQRS